MQDTTTTPTSYQVYYHLAQNSVPEALRVKGAPVYQGQFIGNADDTGYSTGHHLHFMVHTSTYGYWGTSVDITFKDVSINYDPVTQGGRPRRPDEASWYGGQGQIEYTSGNQGTNPPSGELTAPLNGQVVQASTVHVEGLGTDNLGIARMQVLMKDGDTWREVGTAQTQTPFSTDVDLCAAGAADGPVTLALRTWDLEGNQSVSPLTPRGSRCRRRRC